MKKFRFRLEALLKVREHIEKERQKEHAFAVKRVQKQKAELESIDSDREQTCELQAKRSESVFSVADMLIYSRYFVKLKRDQILGSELFSKLNQEAKKKQEILAEATKEKKIFEKLKEKNEISFNNAARKTETAESDEIAIRNYIRRKK